MTTLHLDKFLSGHVFGFMLIFARLGSGIMLMPGIGEAFVSQRIRLFFALSLSFLLMEPLLPRLPAPPPGIADFARVVAYEVVIGLFFGYLMRLIMNVLETTGMVIGIQSGLSNATVLNPAQAAQSPLPSAFLAMSGLVLFFITGLDHLLLRALVSLYDIFPPNGEWMPGDMAQTIIQAMSKSFVVGIELAMPFFIGGLLMFISMGLIQKLLPSIQLFLVMMPVQIWGGLFLMSITMAGILGAWLMYADSTLGQFIKR